MWPFEDGPPEGHIWQVLLYYNGVGSSWRTHAVCREGHSDELKSKEGRSVVVVGIKATSNSHAIGLTH